jgi:hypothetical protein
MLAVKALLLPRPRSTTAANRKSSLPVWLVSSIAQEHAQVNGFFGIEDQGTQDRSWSSRVSLHLSSRRSPTWPCPVLTLPIVVAPIGHPVAQGDVQEAGAQPGLRQVFRPDVARHQRVRPGDVPGVEDAKQHLVGPVGQPLRPQLVHHEPRNALAQGTMGGIILPAHRGPTRPSSGSRDW